MNTRSDKNENEDGEKAFEGGFFASLGRNATRLFTGFSKPIAGTLSGMVEETTSFPLDLIKTRIQVSKSTSHTGILRIFKDVIKQEGAIGLFKGLSSPLLSSALITAIQFGLFEDTLKYFRNHNYLKNHDTICLILSGGISGFVQSFITCPVDLIKVQLQTHGLNNNNNSNNSSNNSTSLIKKGNIYFAKKIYKERGILGFYQGLSPTLFRDVPGLAIFFTVYEEFKKHFNQDSSISTDSPKEFIKSFIPILIGGGSAGVLYHGLTHPFDIAKTLIQTDQTSKKYKGTFDCLKQIYKLNGGFKSLFKGFAPVAIKSFQSNAVGFLVYELVINANKL